MEKQNYAEQNWGTQSASPIRMERIEVVVSVDHLVKDYCAALVNKLENHATLLQQAMAIEEDELHDYLSYLLTQRCHQVAGKCKNWGALKQLWIPSYFQWILSCVGEYRDRSYAIHIVPVMDKDSEMDYETAKAFSDRLGEFECVTPMERAAMPTGTQGDQAVMSCAIIDNTVRSMSRDVHPAQVYVAAFANMQLRKEAAFAALYRSQYDDLDTIAMQMSAKDVL